MLHLRAGERDRESVATILPQSGAAFARLAHAGRELLVPLPDGAEADGGWHGAFLMAPWTNRLDGGRIVVAGTEHRMAITRPLENTALHGFLRELPWDVLRATEATAELACRFARGPFAGAARLAVALAEDHLALSLAITNGGAVPTPFGIGWHPFFARPPGTRLTAAARTVFGRDVRNLPVAPRPSAGVEGGDAALDGLDTHFAGWDGAARIERPDGTVLLLRATGDWASNLQVFAPKDAGILCVEPVSHAPDAPNRPDAAAHGAMHVLAPGESLAGSLTIHWR